MAVITEDGLIATFMKITPKYLERKKRREELDERKY